MSKPFARAIAFMAAMQAALAKGDVFNEVYVSRGKGREKHSGKKWGPAPSGRYTGVENGEREMERRFRQLSARATAARATT